MRSLVCAILLSLSVVAHSADYDLSLGAEVSNGTLKVAPTVTGPSGAQLRYDVTTTRTGRNGDSNSRQSGNVTLSNDGKASLSQVSVNVTPQDRYTVHVEVYDGQQVVAAKTLRHPKD